MTGFFIFETIKSVWMYAATPATPFIIIVMAIFAFIAVLSMALIMNGENRNVILRKELEFYSNQDPMTHLPNIRFFKNNVGHLITQRKTMAIVMLDVDYFKVYNEKNICFQTGENGCSIQIFVKLEDSSDPEEKK